MYTYIYIYIYNWTPVFNPDKSRAANLRTAILDFGGFDSGIILMIRGGILMSIGNFLEMLSQIILVWIILIGIILAGRLGVGTHAKPYTDKGPASTLQTPYHLSKFVKRGCVPISLPGSLHS